MNEGRIGCANNHALWGGLSVAPGHPNTDSNELWGKDSKYNMARPASPPRQSSGWIVKERSNVPRRVDFSGEYYLLRYGDPATDSPRFSLSILGLPSDRLRASYNDAHMLFQYGLVDRSSLAFRLTYFIDPFSRGMLPGQADQCVAGMHMQDMIVIWLWYVRPWVVYAIVILLRATGVLKLYPII